MATGSLAEAPTEFPKITLLEVYPKVMKMPELRRYRRIVLDAEAQIIVNGIDEYRGRLINMSPGDLAIKCEGKVAIGDAASISVKNLDRVEGTVARVFPDGFAMSFRLSQSRRMILLEQLMIQANKPFAEDLKDRRSTPRHPAGGKRIVCRLQDGSSLFVKAIDMSVDGIAVESHRKPPVGSEIQVGRHPGVIIRHTPRGFVVVYDLRASQTDKSAQTTHLRAV
ncbi:MAG: PilZ domain-containing protein [Pseudomonadota bacterium]